MTLRKRILEQKVFPCVTIGSSPGFPAETSTGYEPFGREREREGREREKARDREREREREERDRAIAIEREADLALPGNVM